MLILLSSAAFVGFVHSLAPNHWLPVVVLGKARRWSRREMVLGAGVTATGHLVSSGLMAVALGALGGWIALHFGQGSPEATAEWVEHRMSLVFGSLLISFGLGYAIYHLKRHSDCHGHGHHGPNAPGARASTRKALVFLFTLGLNPCLAVAPLIVAAGAQGVWTLLATLAAYGIAVYLAMMGATFLLLLGVTRVDHPLIEHYGEVITGLGIVLAGVFVLTWHEVFGF